MNKKIKIALKSSAVLLIGSAMTIYFTSRKMYNNTIRRSESKEKVAKRANRNQEKSEQAKIVFEEGKIWFEEHLTEVITIQSHDGLNLNGYYFEAPNQSDITIIRVHGYGSSARKSTLASKMFQDEFNANILAPDLRGHGNSDGEYVGFGWHDRLDIINWIHYIIERNGKEHKIVLFGGSMGAATVMMVSGEELPPNVKLIIEDCGYSSVDKILQYQIKNSYSLPKNPIIPIVERMTKRRAGYNFEEASAIAQVENAKVPMLFIHGGKDVFVPTAMVYDLYNACSTDKDILVVGEAGHNESFIVNPKRYTEFIKEFMEKYVC